MTSLSVNVLKCISCNLVVNELLTFVQNKHEVMDSESLVRICTTAFSTEDVEKAKSLLFQSISSVDFRKIKRKNKDGKSKKDLFDIIEVFKSLDPEKIPIFVAQDLNKLPPITFDHVDVSRLLKDIIILQNEITLIKSNYVTTDQLLQTRNEIMETNKECSRGAGSCVECQRAGGSDSLCEEDILRSAYRNINMRRGACLGSPHYDSGPMELTHNLSVLSTVAPECMAGSVILNNSCDYAPSHFTSNSIASKLDLPSVHTSPSERVLMKDTTVSDKELCSQRPAVRDKELCSRRPALSDVTVIPTVPYCGKSVTEASIPKRGASGAVNSALSTSVTAEAASSKCLFTNSFAQLARADGEWKEPKINSEWIEVQRKRYRNRFIGNKGSALTKPECTFRAADIKTPLFINNVDKSASIADIVEFIKDKTQVGVTLEKIQMKQQRDYDAYKIFVPRLKLELFMNDSTWPEGISFRRFIDFGNGRRTNKLYDGSHPISKHVTK